MTLLFLLMSFLQKYLIFNKVKSKKKNQAISWTQWHLPHDYNPGNQEADKFKVTYIDTQWVTKEGWKEKKEREGRRMGGREGDKKQQKKLKLMFHVFLNES